MAEEFQYQKERQKFGRTGAFEDTDIQIVGSVIHNETQEAMYQLRNPNKVVLDNIPVLSEHRVNTERVATNNRGMSHKVGGWPAGIDWQEPAEVNKYMRKLAKEPSYGYVQAAKDLVAGASRSIKQNNQLDLFEEYFEGEEPEFMSEPISTKTVMIFKDPNKIKRAVTRVCWHPETTELRVGVAYATMAFQQTPAFMSKQSYIWNLNNPNTPEKTLDPTSPLTCMSFSQKITDIIVAGSHNGSLAFFDQKRGSSNGVIKPVETTVLEKSHHDPVYDVYWCAGKTGTECVSVSTDGRILWWDMKMLGNGPTEELTLEENFEIDGETIPKVLGATSLEYNGEYSSLKFLCGTEQGYCLQANKRAKKIDIALRFGIESGKHHGPVYSIERNPVHQKYFLTIGDWTARIWSEELQSHPIMQTRYHHAYLSDGCWSPTRPGLFFLTRTDGFLDVWDFFYRQNEVAYSQKIADSKLTCIKIAGSMAAIGDADGTVSMVSLCKTLWDPAIQPREKEVMGTIFDRETRREKMLYTNKIQAAKQKPPAEKKTSKDKIAQKLDAQLATIEETFFNSVAEGDDQEIEAIKARGGAEGESADGGAVTAANQDK